MQGRSRLKRNPIKACCVRVGLAPRSFTGFAAVVLLLAKAVGAKALTEIASAARGDVQIYVAELSLYEKGAEAATWFLKCVATVACIAVTIVWRTWRAAEPKEKKVVERNVMVQSPVTYKGPWAQPRFHPLPEHDWGAWSD